MQKQSDNLIKFIFTIIFIFWQYTYTIFTGHKENIYQYPIDKICRQINCKYLLQILKMKNTIIFKRECLMCAIARFSYSNSEFFLNFLLKTHTNISCVQITPSHKCDKNQLCNTVTNTVKHTLSIIISLLFSLDLTHKTITKNEQKWKEIFFSKYVYYSPTIEL